jgi:tetratricopeptide (TPR) repeat protein
MQTYFNLLFKPFFSVSMMQNMQYVYAGFTMAKQYKGPKRGAEKASKVPAKVLEPLASPEAIRKLKKVLGIIVAAFAILLYAQSISFKYTLDDGTVIKENKLTTKGISSITQILTHSYWYGFNKSDDATYRPTSLVMLAIEYQVFGDNPHINHLINLLLYGLTCWLLFLLLCKLFTNQNLLFPFICSLLYVAHPIHTEVVDSIKSRDEILCFLFAVSSALLLLRYVNRNSVVALLSAGVCFFLSLISKETGTTFFIVLPLMLYVFTKADVKKIIMVVLLLGVFTAGYFFIRSQILQSVTTTRKLLAIDNTLMAAPDALGQKATAFYILLKYIFLLVFPYPLSYDYSFSQIKIQQITDGGAIFGILFYVAIGIYAIINIRKKNFLAFAILYFVITLAPASNLLVIIGSTMAERFMYVPSLGFCIVITYFLIKLTKVESIKSRFSTVSQFIKSNKPVFTLTFIIIFLYSLQTISRSMDWHDNVRLFGGDVKVADKSARAHYNWASSLLLDSYPKEKNKSKKDDIINHSIAEFVKAINIFPNYADAHMNLALAYTDKEAFNDAINSYEMARKLYPKPTAKLYNNLGLLYGKTGKFSEALACMDSALKIEPEFAEAYNNKGNALAGLGKFREALPEFQKAIDLNKKYSEAYRNMGSTYGNMGQFPKALDYFFQAAKNDSTDVTVYSFIAVTYQNMKDSLNAKIYYDKANKLKEEQEK